MLVGLKTRLKKNQDDKVPNLHNLGLAIILFGWTRIGLYRRISAFPDTIVFKEQFQSVSEATSQFHISHPDFLHYFFTL